jgi:hypothetical protein
MERERGDSGAAHTSGSREHHEPPGSLMVRLKLGYSRRILLQELVYKLHVFEKPSLQLLVHFQCLPDSLPPHALLQTEHMSEICSADLFLW